MATDTESVLKQLDVLIKKYQPGGEFGRGELALLERHKTKSLARTQAGMVSAGLAGTTAAAGAGQKWEEEIGMPSRLRIEDMKSQRLMQAMQAKAGYTERAEARSQQEAEAQRQRVFEESMARKYGGPGGGAAGGGGAGTNIGDRPGWALGEQAWESPGYQPGGAGAGADVDYRGAQSSIYGGGGGGAAGGGGADAIYYDIAMQKMQQAGKVGGYGAGGADLSRAAYDTYKTETLAKAKAGAEKTGKWAGYRALQRSGFAGGIGVWRASQGGIQAPRTEQERGLVSQRMQEKYGTASIWG